MTNITIKAFGASITANADGKLTSGMVGIPVSIDYDDSWDGLIKTASFRVGKFVRSRENIGTETTVPWEVMRYSGKPLEVGVEGKNEDGNIVIPTIWTPVSMIYSGANASIPAAPNPESDDVPSGGGGAIIDDSEISDSKVWSSEKIDKEIKVLGDNIDSIRVGVEGVLYSRNLLPTDYYSGDSITTAGITFNKQTDGTIVATGTATTSARFEVVFDMPIKAGTYTLSGIPEATNTAGKRFLKYCVLETPGEYHNYLYIKSGSATITIEKDSFISVRIEYQVNYDINGQEVWAIMLEEGTMANEYVQPGSSFDSMQKNIDEHTKQIADHANQIAEIQEALEEKPESADENALPAYYTDYMEDRIAAINDKDCLIGGHGDSFVFITDTHIERNNMQSPKLIRQVVDNTAVRFVINGGDTLDRNSTRGEALGLLRQWRNLMRGVTEYRIMGNHDLNASGQTVTEAILSFDDWYGTMVKPIEDMVKTDGKFYFCIDNESQKIRYICLSYKVNLTAERNWFKQRLTELEAGWTVLVIPHYLFDSTTDVIHANGQMVIDDINEVYANMNATLIGVLAGHTHADYSTTEETNGYHLIAVTCDAFTGTPTKTAGTVTEQAFDVIHIDTANRKLYATRIGAGEDREWSY